MTNETLKLSDHRKVAAFMADHAGIQLPDKKRNLVEARLRHRLLALGFKSMSQYVAFALEQDSSERRMLVDVLTTNKTDFLREAAHFDVLLNTLDAQWPDGAAVRIWSAGCSTGEEPYSLAMVLSLYREKCPEFTFGILATDISQSCLAVARQAVYSTDCIEPVPESWRRRFLLRSRDASRPLVRIAPELRQLIRFEPFNLMQDDFGRLDLFDAIFCRNVMIYFSSEDRARLVQRFRNQLKSGGLLVVGMSEGIASNRELFHQVSPSVYQKIGQ